MMLLVLQLVLAFAAISGGELVLVFTRTPFVVTLPELLFRFLDLWSEFINLISSYSL